MESCSTCFPRRDSIPQHGDTVISILTTAVGGMGPAVTDFVQMIILVAGLAILAVFAGNMAGGADKVISLAVSKDLFRFWPEPSFKDIVFFFAAAITMMLGSIPQQDVFQRVMSAKNISAATKGPVIGGVCYILFAFVPMFLVTSALIIMPEQTQELLKDDPQKVLPTLVLEKMPFVMQVLFFGALLSASSHRPARLAPSVTSPRTSAEVRPRTTTGGNDDDADPRVVFSTLSSPTHLQPGHAILKWCRRLR